MSSTEFRFNVMAHFIAVVQHRTLLGDGTETVAIFLQQRIPHSFYLELRIEHRQHSILSSQQHLWRASSFNSTGGASILTWPSRTSITDLCLLIFCTAEAIF